MLLALAVGALTVSGDDSSSARPKDGAYNLTVAGFVKSNGDSNGSTVSGNQINLRAKIVSEKGEAGLLNATGLTLKGSYFHGSGTVLGQTAIFNGRLDFPDGDKDRGIRGVRLVCTVKTSDGKYARVIGFIPALANARDNVDEEERDRGRGKPSR